MTSTRSILHSALATGFTGRWLVAAALLASPLPGAAGPAIDMPAPDFALRTFAGHNVRLSEFRGNVVVISFWATWCGPCQQELPRLKELHERYARAGLITLGVNLDDDSGRARDMGQRLAVTFPLLLDQTREIARLYQVDAMPMTVLIDREGRVRHVHEVFRADDGPTYLEQVRHLIDE